MNSWLGSIVTIKAFDIIESSKDNYTLYLPRFIEKRVDKDTADSLDRIKEISKM